jgi:hypothetical protein
MGELHANAVVIRAWLSTLITQETACGDECDTTEILTSVSHFPDRLRLLLASVFSAENKMSIFLKMGDTPFPFLSHCMRA